MMRSQEGKRYEFKNALKGFKWKVLITCILKIIEERYSQLVCNLNSCKKKALKKSRTEQDWNQ